MKSASRIVKLLHPKSASVVVDESIGTTNDMEVSAQTARGKMYLHNEDSFKRLWKKVGDKTAICWRVETRSDTPEDIYSYKKNNPDAIRIKFWVERV